MKSLNENVLTEEQKENLFYFDQAGFGWSGHWYNMDVSNLPVRSTSERYDWNIKNRWLKNYHQRRNHIVFSAHCVLDQCGFQTPKYISELLQVPSELDPWVHDTTFDLSYIPEYNLCLKVGLECAKGFEYMQHGCWSDYLTAHMLRALGRTDECVKHITKWRNFHDELDTKYPNNRQYEPNIRPHPKWMDEWLCDLGAAEEIV